jgi:hypothetical protein
MFRRFNTRTPKSKLITMVNMKRQRPSSPSRKPVLWYLIFAGVFYLLILWHSQHWFASCNFDASSPVALLPAKQSYDLAAKQSDGLFTTIPDAGWKRMQQRARTSIQYMYPDTPEIGYQDPKMWYLNNLQVSALLE